MRAFIFGSLLFIFLIAGACYSQVWVRSVDIPCFVTDKAGRFVTDLTQSNFLVKDNGKVQKITGIKEKLQSPLSVALVLDRSKSVAGSFPILRTASEEFLGSIIRKGQDRSCLVAFDSHVYLLQDWTDDLSRIDSSLEGLKTSGGTALFDAIYKTCRDKFPSDETDDRTRVIVLITDGEDTTSHATLSQVIDMVSQSGAFVYVLGIKSESSLNPRELQGKRVLAELRNVTGGEILYPKDEGGKLEDLFRQIEKELRNEYVVTFTTNDEPDGKFHKIKVETNRAGLSVHSRKEGYFAAE